ncbi:MAG TPA: TIGR03016 family PEP-CTERM system-associated outer membrane protein [Rhodanobacteraceae bacterium]
MRTLTTPVLLSSLLLGGWMTSAVAQQDVNPETPPALPAGGEAGLQETAIGVVPQPTPDNPGLVTGITLGELYTDNVGLAARGKPSRDSFITQIEPFIKSGFRTPRVSGMFDFSLTGYQYAGGPSHHQLAADLNGQATAVLIPQHLFIDGMATYGRQVVNNALPVASGTYFLDNNQANVASASLSPYWVQDLGPVGTMILRYSHGRVLYNDRNVAGDHPGLLSGLPDTASNGVQFSLTSPKFETWGWNLGYSDQRLDPDFGSSIEFANARVGISRQVSQDLQLLADVGKETKFLPNGTYERLGSGYWDVGFEWSNTLNSLKLMAGHRFFGHSYDFSWTHVAALLSTTLSYIEQPTDLNQQLLAQNPSEILTAPPTTSSLIPSLLDRRVYLMKRATASATYTMPKGSLNLTVYDESRDFLNLGGGHENVANAGVSWLFELGARTTLTPTLGWQRYRFTSGQITYTRTGGIALAYQLNSKNFGSIRLRNESASVFEPIPGARGYRVNVLFVQWTHLF